MVNKHSIPQSPMDCPCHSGSPYKDCCEPFISEKSKPETAEALMRSRYTAYVVHDIPYLLKTWHPSTRPSGIEPETIPRWCSLQIIRTTNRSEKDDRGIVEFRATAFSGITIFKLHEVSRFIKENDRWFYVDGDILENSTHDQKSGKIGRNAPCPCGSGKKFKKCCGP